MAIELLKLTRVLNDHEELDAVLRTFDVDKEDVDELFRLRGRLADGTELYVVDDQLDALPAAKVMAGATDMQHVSLAMWLGGRWELYDVAAVIAGGQAYVDQPQWNQIYGMPAFE